MLPDINYRNDGYIPSEISEEYKRMSNHDSALTQLLHMHYGNKVNNASKILKQVAVTDAAPDPRHHAVNRIRNTHTFTPHDQLVVEVGYGMFFRALQVVTPLTLERVASLLLYSGMLWPTFANTNTTLDIVYAPASDPGPPFDGDTEYAIIVVPQGMRGVSLASRYYRK